ncbi:hypothetical protein [Uliginosibacterium aquaticum]|uniref:Uncharacterized protein n=1 Tax=Uliginosibacterium aquaticum TaxID=2731212 RepID=A0ABX2IB70_9RHOO|nr:hypothetical protein [Uliginosibacterium aquaticum]NSL53660.1 hypothetical protein [Uliginosibacterium aquaticum]
MQIKSPLLITTLGLSLLALAGQASAASVSTEQLKSISAGQSRAEVLKNLGKPDATPRWADGTQSLVYPVRNGDSPSTRAYVTVGAGDKVLSVQLDDDGGTN